MRRERAISIVLCGAAGALRVAVRIPDPEMRLADLAAIAYALTEAIAGQRNAMTSEAGRPIRCRAGCAACCRELVPISAPEALLLADTIDRLDADSRRSVLARFADVEARLGPQRLAARLAESRDSVARRVLAKDYFARRVDCPFLADELCSIHPLRPVACRSYGVTSPAAWCSEPATHRVEPVAMPPHLSVPLARVAAALTGEPAAPIALALLPAWLLAHADLRLRSWPSAPLLARFLTEVGAWPERPGEQGDGAARVEGIDPVSSC